MSKNNAVIPIYSDNLPEKISNVDKVADFIQFAAWCATPRETRQPKTQKELAESIGISEDTLCNWKKHPQFFPITRYFINRWIQERVPEVLYGLCSKARFSGSAREVELFLRLAGIDVNQTNKPKK